MDMTVIGDTVNLASRIEGLTRIYGCDILVDERIARKAREICPFLEVDVVRVEGSQETGATVFPHKEEHLEWAEAFAAARAPVSRGRIRSRAGCL